MLRGSSPVALRCGARLLDLSTPLVMGIMNVTPDSFYPDSRVEREENFISDFAGKMIEEGASILDIGGMSTRPGAEAIEVNEELDRVLPAIEIVKKHYPHMIISLDTYQSQVARQGLKAGADIINDISGGNLDKGMITTVAEAKAPFVLMHMRGNPATMQSLTGYENVVKEVAKYFVEILRVLKKAGITEVILDPGFGFSKTMQQNYELIRHLHVFNMLGCPMMIGLSRKSTLSKTIGRPVEDTLEATSALHLAALQGGAKILRVHDVRAAKDVIAVYQQLHQNQNPY